VGVAVRPARTNDAPGIRAVHVAAFPTAVEADLVEQLHRDGDVVLSLVAAEGETIIGHVLLSRLTADGDGRAVRAVGLAPVAVLPDRQRQGIGAALVAEAVARMRGEGEDFVFLLGAPAYYRRFGFAPETAAPFASPYAGPYFMALALCDAAVPESGRADYAAAFAGLE
jgi:putative acetyltransferase